MGKSIPRRIHSWGHMDPAGDLVETDLAIDQREKRPIASGANILASVELGSILANDDAAGGDELGAKRFDAQPLAIAVATVP